jgi:hypothetical protein
MWRISSDFVSTGKSLGAGINVDAALGDDAAIVGRALRGVAHETPELGELLRLELGAREFSRAAMLSRGTPPDEGLGEHGWAGSGLPRIVGDSVFGAEDLD